MIYALVDPRTERVRYVGQSAAPKRRYREHLVRPAPPIAAWLIELGPLRPALRLLSGFRSERAAMAAHRPDLNRRRGVGHAGRPAASARVHALTIWFTLEERDEIERRKGTLSSSTWVREQLLNLMAMP